MILPLRRSLVLVVWGLLQCAWLAPSAAAAVTKEQRAKLKELHESLLSAGQLYGDGQYLQSSELVRDVQQELLELLQANDPALNRLAKPLYVRLEKAHGLLVLEGAQLNALPTWRDVLDGKLAAPDSEPSANLSFASDIAPWLITACGNCHIRSQRGQFSLVSFEALTRGVRNAKVVYDGDAKGSRLVEVIESGDMPRGNGPAVTPDQLDALKRWIDQGAEFDGPRPDAPLTSYAEVDATTAPSGRPTAPSVQPATDQDTVSFARQIAPILTENCNGCHINGRRASGGLRMDTFAQLLRGGDSGEVVAGSNANDSLLIKKLRGQSGQRMPAGGRPALSEEQISLISTWIREGARFDGPSPDTPLEVLINEAWAAEATHEELFQRRQERILASWRRTLPDDEPATASTEEIFVLGNIPPQRLTTIADQAQAAIAQVKKLLKAPSKEPLVRGGIGIFVLKSRYDYSEFGRMTENRELPKQWLGHWRADPLDVYAVVSGEAGVDEQQFEGLVLQVVAGAYLGSFSAVPEWFAEGVARNLVLTSFRRSDERVKQWQAGFPAAVQKVDDPRSLLENRLDEEAAGLVGMGITRFMMDRGNRRRFDKLLELLRDGRSFDEATTFAFGPPEAIVKAWLGKPAGKR